MATKRERLRDWWDQLDAPKDRPGVRAAASNVPSISAGLGAFTWTPITDGSRSVAMSLPTVQRARDILCAGLGSVELAAFLWDRIERSLTPHPNPPTWLDRPDPDRTRAALVADTVDDMLFHGVAYWRVTERDAAGWPLAFRHLPAAQTSQNDDKTWRSGDSERIPARDVLVMESAQTGVLFHGSNTLDTAIKLEDAANRFAATEVPAGWLAQTGGIPLTPKEQTEMAARFQTARKSQTVAMLSEHVEWHESSFDPSRLQLTEGRQHMATELARLCNVPAAVVHAPTNDSLTYSNEADQRADLWYFGIAPLAEAIQQTLSGPNVTPRGTVVRFDPYNPASDIGDPFTKDETTNVPNV